MDATTAQPTLLHAARNFIRKSAGTAVLVIAPLAAVRALNPTHASQPRRVPPRSSFTASAALTTAPTGQLVLAGADITIGTGAKIDGRGGGDVFAYEFVSGTGGSRDVLSRLNSDAFSSNDGLQFADGRQVYLIDIAAIVGAIAATGETYALPRVMPAFKR